MIPLDLLELPGVPRIETDISGQRGVQRNLPEAEQEIVEFQGIEFVQGVEVIDAVPRQVPLEDRLLKGLGGEAAKLKALRHRESQRGDAAFVLKRLPESRMPVVGNHVPQIGVAAGLREKPSSGHREVVRRQADTGVGGGRRDERGEQANQSQGAEQRAQAAA